MHYNICAVVNIFFYNIVDFVPSVEYGPTEYWILLIS